MPPRPKQPKAAYILNVPVELVILFAQHLPVFEQYMLAQVSIAFRSILKTRFDRYMIKKVLPQEWLLYLTIRATQLPNHWVCEQCLNIHRYNPQDTPSLAHFSDGIGGCPRKATIPYFRPMFLPGSFHFQNFHLHHRHVQLALKYDRMGGPPGGPLAQRLSRLLASGFHEPMSEDKNFSMGGFQTQGNGRFSWKPKIDRGRFLLTTIIEFYPTGENLAGLQWDIVPAIRMCQHQMWMPECFRRFMNDEEPIIFSDEEAIFNDLHEAVINWQPKMDEPKMITCQHCETYIEISWSVRAGNLKFTAIGWHDFGPETSPVSSLWLSKHLDAPDSRLHLE